MYILNFEAFLIAITILTLTPGLDTALVIKNTSRSGSTDGYVTSLGICSGLFIHATFSAIGISAILLQSAELFQTMKWIGACYLIWLGIKVLKSRNLINLTPAAKQPLKVIFTTGFLSAALYQSD